MTRLLLALLLAFPLFAQVPPNGFERILIPVLIRPIDGSFGSRFVTAFHVELLDDPALEVFGLEPPCRVTCIVPDHPSLLLMGPGHVLGPSSVEENGRPGRFLFVPQGATDRLAMNLRVYDTSRSLENFGTEVPLVRERDMRNRVALPDVPANAAPHRLLMRIYATEATTARVTIRAFQEVQTFDVPLRAGETLYDPAYAEFGSFPSTGRNSRVTVEASAPLWAFISVTNNDTQMITTITPQP